MFVGTVRLCLCLLAACLVASQARATASGLLRTDTAVLQEMYHLWSSKVDDIWPTAGKTRIPVIYIKSDTEYAIGFPNAIHGFSPVTTTNGFDMPLQARSRTFATDLSASFLSLAAQLL